MHRQKSSEPIRPMNAEHQAIVDSYLGGIRAASEDFAEAFRAQTEALMALKEEIEGASTDLDASGKEGGNGMRQGSLGRDSLQERIEQDREGRVSRRTPDPFN